VHSCPEKCKCLSGCCSVTQCPGVYLAVYHPLWLQRYKQMNKERGMSGNQDTGQAQVHNNSTL
jgi:hypothetical protein